MRVNTWGLCEQKVSLLLTFILGINNVFKKCLTKKSENGRGKVGYNESYKGGVGC